MVLKEQFVGPGEVVQLVEILLYKQGDLSLDLQHPYNKLGAVTCSCNPMARNKMARQSLELIGCPF